MILRVQPDLPAPDRPTGLSFKGKEYVVKNQVVEIPDAVGITSADIDQFIFHGFEPYRGDEVYEVKGEDDPAPAEKPKGKK